VTFRKRASVVLALAVLGACARGPARVEMRRPTPAPNAPPVAGTARPPFLRIAPVTIFGSEMQAPEGACCARCAPAAEPWLVVYENGLLTVRGNPLGRLRPDGRFVDLDGADRILMAPSGHVTMAPGTQNPIAGIEIIVAEDGTVTRRLPDFPDEPADVTSLAAPDDCGVLGSTTQANGRATLERCLCTHLEEIPSDRKRTVAFARVVSDIVRWLSLSACHYGSTGVCRDYPGDAPASNAYDGP
jgi:hypothetical protein